MGTYKKKIMPFFQNKIGSKNKNKCKTSILPIFKKLNHIPYFKFVPHIDSNQSLCLFTKINKPFILNSSITFFTKLLYKPKQQSSEFKYIFKKKLFSFLYPNEVFKYHQLKLILNNQYDFFTKNLFSNKIQNA